MADSRRQIAATVQCPMSIARCRHRPSEYVQKQQFLFTSSELMVEDTNAVVGTKSETFFSALLIFFLAFASDFYISSITFIV